MKVLFDSNVIIDGLTRREGSELGALPCLEMVATLEIEGHLCAKQLTDIHYVLMKYIQGENERLQIIGKLMNLFHIIPLTKNNLNYGLLSETGDFEDAVLVSSALYSHMDCIITNDKKHFLNAPLPCFTPSDFLSHMQKMDN